MDTEKIFGPLTFRQFLYVAPGFGICFYLYKSFGLKTSLPFIILIAGIILALVLNAPKVVIDENYIKVKRETTDPQIFTKWILMKKALIESQIQMRKERGSVVDPKLESMRILFESYSEKKNEIK